MIEIHKYGEYVEITRQQILVDNCDKNINNFFKALNKTKKAAILALGSLNAVKYSGRN